MDSLFLTFFGGESSLSSLFSPFESSSLVMMIARFLPLPLRYQLDLKDEKGGRGVQTLWCTWHWWWWFGMPRLEDICWNGVFRGCGIKVKWLLHQSKFYDAPIHTIHSDQAALVVPLKKSRFCPVGNVTPEPGVMMLHCLKHSTQWGVSASGSLLRYPKTLGKYSRNAFTTWS